ncbi:MAG: oxidoreductase [Candidatus Eisenbacteria bacterium]|nr:oxidoreductase [Candidatus Eisenbacteria bacterium]
MNLFLAALACLAAGTVLPALLYTRPRTALAVALACAWGGALLGLPPAVAAMLGAPALQVPVGWTTPLGVFTMGLDPLSGFFLVPVLVVTALAALAGHHRLTSDIGSRRAVMAACFFNALTASMALVLVARDAVFFLVGWELMSLTSYFLVTYEDDSAEVQRAGFVYLVAAHVGAAFLLVFFTLLAGRAGSFLFDAFAAAGPSVREPLLLLSLALLGFGTKAGIAPLHVWLPRAHPAAPGHVSAVMSGIMIKMGIYGLLRALSFLGPPSPGWGYVFLALGAVSAIGGVVFALAQQDLKRMLAYSSVENVGIVCLAIGAALLGRAYGNAALAALGFAGALLHVWNHAAFKSLLFLAAGETVHATGERDLNKLGGLMRPMPWTGALFLAGSVAICGLPPFNGFVSEWLMYWGFFAAGPALPGQPAAVCLGAAVALAMVGALAVACFGRAFGVAFLGHPRSRTPLHPHEADAGSRAAMLALGAACAALGAFPAPALRACRAAVEGLTPGLPSALPVLDAAGTTAARVGVFALALVCAAAALFVMRDLLLRGRAVSRGPTWGCGYERPAPRMQYSGSSFVQPLLELFRDVVPRRVSREPVEGLFPGRASLTSHPVDPAEHRLFRPAFTSLPELLARFRWMQRVPVQAQLLYILVGLIALLALGLGGVPWAR